MFRFMELLGQFPAWEPSGPSPPSPLRGPGFFAPSATEKRPGNSIREKRLPVMTCVKKFYMVAFWGIIFLDNNKCIT